MPKTNAEFKAWLQSLGSQMVTTVAGLPETAPKEFKDLISTFKDKLNLILAGLPPLEQAQASLECSWGVNCVIDAMASATQTLDRLRERYPALVLAGAQSIVDEKITKGELMTTESVNALIATKTAAARKEGEEGAVTRLTLLNTRKLAVVTAGLPEMTEAILIGEQAAFDTAVSTAAARKKKLEDAGMKDIEVKTFAGLVYGPQDSFDGQFATFERLLAAGKKSGGGPDPMKGGSGAPAAKRALVC